MPNNPYQLSPLIGRRQVCAGIASVPLLSLAGTAAGQTAEEAAAYLKELADAVPNLGAFEAIAKTKVRRGPWGWLSSGAEDEQTLRANREIFKQLELKTRRLIDVSKIDTRVTLFGQSYASPVGFSPVGFQRLFHPEAEIGLAKGAEAHGGPMVAGFLTSERYSDIARHTTRKPWVQLYDRWDRGIIKAALDEIAAAGCPAVALTVDTPVGGNRETSAVYEAEMVMEGPLTAGNLPPGVPPLNPPNAATNWVFVEWLQKNTRMKVVLKGIVTAEDAKLAKRAGVDGIFVSNHGGRQEESGRSSLESLSEVMDAVGGTMPVLVDSGFRRGSDIFKALAFGADAVFVGRPQVWGLASFGSVGVSRVLEILNSELRRVMTFAGTTALAQIGRDDLYPVAGGSFERFLAR